MWTNRVVAFAALAAALYLLISAPCADAARARVPSGNVFGQTSSPVTATPSGTITFQAMLNGTINPASLPYCTNYTGKHPAPVQAECLVLGADDNLVVHSAANTFFVATHLDEALQVLNCSIGRPCSGPWADVGEHMETFPAGIENMMVAIHHSITLPPSLADNITSALSVSSHEMTGIVVGVTNQPIAMLQPGVRHILNVSDILAAANITLDSVAPDYWGDHGHGGFGPHPHHHHNFTARNGTLRSNGVTIQGQIVYANITSARPSYLLRFRAVAPEYQESNEFETGNSTRVFFRVHGLGITFSQVLSYIGQTTPIETLMEQSAVLQENVHDLEESIALLETRISNDETNVNNIDARVTTQEQMVMMMRQQLKNVTGTVTRLQLAVDATNITMVARQLNHTNALVASLDVEVADLSHEVSASYHNVSQLLTKVATLQVTVSENTQTIEQLRTMIKDLQNQVNQATSASTSDEKHTDSRIKSLRHDVNGSQAATYIALIVAIVLFLAVIYLCIRVRKLSNVAHDYSLDYNKMPTA